MKPLEEYVTHDPASDDFEALCDSRLDFERDRAAVNERVLNFVIKYLASYLEIAETEANQIRDRVKAALKRKLMMVYDEDPKEGVQYDACYARKVPGNDRYGIQCAADLRRTAAIFKEIAFGGRFVNSQHFLGLDIGSGTGILMMAMVVAAKRRGIRDYHVVGIEKSKMAEEQSEKTMSRLIPGDRLSVLCENIVEEFKLSGLFRGMLHYWVSETISLQTPKLKSDQPELGLNPAQLRIRKMEYTSDPFVEAFRNSLREIPHFSHNVEMGRTAMFPDIINGLYKPDRGRSTLLLKTSVRKRPVILEQTSKEFEGYEDFGLLDKRWESPNDVERAAMESDL